MYAFRSHPFLSLPFYLSNLIYPIPSVPHPPTSQHPIYPILPQPHHLFSTLSANSLTICQPCAKCFGYSHVGKQETQTFQLEDTDKKEANVYR